MKNHSSVLSIAERVENWKRFYAKENERKLIGFFYGSEFPAKRYLSATGLPEDRALTPDDFIVDSYLDDYDRLFEEMERCPGDFIFSASAFWGIPWLEAALGCPIRVNKMTGSLYAEKPELYRGPESVPAFDPDSPWLRKLVEFLDKAVERSRGRYPLATTRMRGIADLLSALYGTEELILRMIEQPGEILSAVEKLTAFYIGIGKLQIGRIPRFLGGLGSFYYHAWAPEGTLWHQEDSVMLLSPELYRNFIMPADAEIFRSFRGNIMHFHSVGGYLPLDEVLSLGPTAVEMHIDSGGPSARLLYETHRRILEKAPLIVWGALTEDDFEWIFSGLPDRGVAVNAVVGGRDTALALWERFGRGKA